MATRNKLLLQAALHAFLGNRSRALGSGGLSPVSHFATKGNGRLSRLMADLLVMQLGGERFSWGSTSLSDAGTVRARYIDAWKAADNRGIGLLLEFARS